MYYELDKNKIFTGRIIPPSKLKKDSNFYESNKVLGFKHGFRYLLDKNNKIVSIRLESPKEVLVEENIEESITKEFLDRVNVLLKIEFKSMDEFFIYHIMNARKIRAVYKDKKLIDLFNNYFAKKLTREDCLKLNYG